ncbi:MAG TPA: hypothetical protein VF041_00720 [Gemmatimonadaceae bacterium]
MITRYVALALAMVAMACARSRDKGSAAADSAAARQGVGADSVAGGAAGAPLDSGASPATPAPAASESTTAARDSASAPTGARRAATAADSAIQRARDSLIASRRHLHKGAVTDTGYRPPPVTPRAKQPERRPMYPPLEKPLAVPRDSGDTSGASDTTATA